MYTIACKSINTSNTANIIIIGNCDLFIAMRIHLSQMTADILLLESCYHLIPRGEMPIKVK